MTEKRIQLRENLPIVRVYGVCWLQIQTVIPLLKTKKLFIGSCKHIVCISKTYIIFFDSFRANIPNGEVNKGEVLIDYLQPFPPKGIGFQRFVFVLYKQNKRIDFSNFKIDKMSNNNLEKRTFKTLDFYRQYQDDITPAGLAFYQTDYDNSLTKFYHEVLSKFKFCVCCQQKLDGL